MLFSQPACGRRTRQPNSRQESSTETVSSNTWRKKPWSTRTERTSFHSPERKKVCVILLHCYYVRFENNNSLVVTGTGRPTRSNWGSRVQCSSHVHHNNECLLLRKPTAKTLVHVFTVSVVCIYTLVLSSVLCWEDCREPAASKVDGDDSHPPDLLLFFSDLCGHVLFFPPFGTISFLSSIQLAWKQVRVCT